MMLHMASRREVTVNLEKGLHMVPCSRIVEHTGGFGGSVEIHRDDKTVDAKSIFDLLTLNAPQGTILVLEASGDGADDLLNSLEQLFQADFET